MSNPSQRGTYKPSGRVEWGTFLALYSATLVVAMLLAGGMYWLFTAGWYLMILVPIVGALLLVWMLTTAVRVGKVRSAAVGWLAGILAGGLMYVGYFYIGMVATLGIEFAGRLDLLPQYITWRAASDITHDEHHEARPDDRPDPVMNWVWYAFELGLVLYLCGTMAGRRASRAFCERCGKWKEQDIALFPPGNGRTIGQWLAAGEIAKLVGVPTYVPRGRSQRFTSVMVEFCPPDRFTDPCPVYLGAKDIVMGGSATAFQRFDGSPGKMRVRRLELMPDEAASLKTVFPRLSSAVPSPAGSTIGVQSGKTDAPGQPAAVAAAFVDVQPVPPTEARKVLNGATITVGNVLGLMLLPLLLGAFAGIFGGLYLAGLLDSSTAHGPVEAWRLPVGLAISALCLVLTIASGYMAMVNASAIGNNYYHRRAKHYFGMRASPIVDVNRPSDMPTHFVEIVPRQNWGRIMAETATDIGFLQVDARRRELRFEGDRERYRIPAAAVTDCNIQEVAASPGNSRLVHRMVVVSGQTRTGPWEASLCVRQTRWMPPRNHRKISGEALFVSVCSILPGFDAAMKSGVTPANPPAAPLPRPVPATTLVATREGALRRYVITVPIVLIFIGLGVWRGIARSHHKQLGNAAEVPIAAEGGGHDQATLGLQIQNVRTSQRLLEAPPYLAPGGDWTVFDCVPDGDPAALITVAVQQPRLLAGKVPIAFSHAALIPSDRDKGARFVTALAGGLHAPVPAERSSQPLRPLRLGTAVLGEHLSSPEEGLTANGGNWTATKWFIQNEGLDAEVFFNYDLATARAAFSEKDPDYNADVVSGLAAALRDGPRPPRTPENDPNFTTAGPKVVDLQQIPNSAKCSASFARGGKLLILTRQGSPTVVSTVALAAPQQSTPIGQFDGRISGVVCLDVDGNRVVVDEADEPEANTYSPDAPHRIWLIDRKAGTRKQLHGPWGGKGALAGDPEQSLSGDGRYLAVAQWVDTGWGRERRQQAYFIDLVTENSVAVAGTAKEDFFTRWTQIHGEPRALFGPVSGSRAKGNPTLFLGDPVTGTASQLPDSSPRPEDPRVSPDGQLRFEVRGGRDLLLIDGTGASRTFTFHPDDRRFAVEEDLRWLDSRYVQFDTIRPGFIDTATLKMGYLPGATEDSEPPRPTFSADFKWAMSSDSNGIRIGRVVVPDAPQR